MLFRTSSRSDSSSSLSTDDEYSQLPRFIDNRKDVLRPASQPLSTRRQSRHRRHQVALYFLGLLLIIGLVFRSSLAVAWRDFGYIIRPLWGTPDEGSVPWTRIPHYSDPHPDNSDKRAWCALHGWEARGAPGVLVDSLQITSELDLLEIRIREYAGLVSTMIVFESTMTHAGTPREIQIELQMERFERLAREAGIRLLYQTVGEEFEPNLPKGSFENESRQRIAIGDLIREELRLGGIPDGAVILISDTDEILSRETLELISACHIPDNVHFNLKNYRYAFNLLLPDVGKWGPKAVTIRKDVAFGYSASGQRTPRCSRTLGGTARSASRHSRICVPRCARTATTTGSRVQRSWMRSTSAGGCVRDKTRSGCGP